MKARKIAEGEERMKKDVKLRHVPRRDESSERLRTGETRFSVVAVLARTADSMKGLRISESGRGANLADLV